MDSPSQPGNGLQFFIAEKNQVMIVSFVGKFTHKNSEVLERCQQEIVKSQAKWVILYFRDVGMEMDKSLTPGLARLQKAIRDKGLPLRLCSIHPDLRKFLDAQGLLRSDELTNNLVEALKSLPLTTPMIG